MAPPRPRRRERGSILLLAIILVVVLAVLAAAALSWSQKELGAADELRAGDELLACADAGRQHLLSNFKLFNVRPTSLTLAQPVLNADSASGGGAACTGRPGERCMRSGHQGENGMEVQGVRMLPAGGDRSTRNVRDLTNTVATNSMGGSDYQVVVHCRDARGRESEVEFVVRFGF
jgi:hypothetical protein